MLSVKIHCHGPITLSCSGNVLYTSSCILSAQICLHLRFERALLYADLTTDVRVIGLLDAEGQNGPPVIYAVVLSEAVLSQLFVNFVGLSRIYLSFIPEIGTKVWV